MDISIKGKGNIKLSKKDFIASGGEGDIYTRSNVAYKIYHDPKKMIPYLILYYLKTEIMFY